MTQDGITAAAAGPAAKQATSTYLVIGAGTAGLSFIDSILTLDADATVILVDRNKQPGGHWTKAYPFVRLHQASCNYGVNSLPLSKVRDRWGNERFSVHDRASGRRILQYYETVVEQFRECGRVELHFNCEYAKDEGGNHTITDADTKEVTRVSCEKVVMIRTNVVVPSMRDGPPFPVDSSIHFEAVNHLPKHVESKQFKKYVVIGAGKTGSDAITYLLRNGVDQSAITWIASRDMWYIVRDVLYGECQAAYRKGMGKIIDPLVKCKSLHDAMMLYEKDGLMARLDKSRFPPVFKAAVIDKSELAGFRSIEDIVRLGRVRDITSGEIELERGTVPLTSPADTLFVDCMAGFDGTSYPGYRFHEGFKIFDGDQINLGPMLAVFNFSFSSAIIAYVESTFADDPEMRNGMLYFAAGDDHAKANHMLLFGALYTQLKTFEALGAYPPAKKFILNSRTYLDAPHHHHLGLVGLLWTAFGPAQMFKKGNTFVERIESGYYSDCQDCFGCKGRKPLKLSDLKLKEKKSNAMSNYPPRKSEKESKPKSKKSSLSCCATVDVLNPVEKSRECHLPATMDVYNDQ